MMTATRVILGGVGMMVLCALAVVAQDAPDKGTLATQIAEGRKQNQLMLRDYTWNTRTEVKIDGEVKSVKVDLVRFTPEGELQKTKISDSADGQKKPRGIKGKVASKKVKGMKEWAGDLAAVLQKYRLPTAGSILDFMGEATAERTGALVTAVATDVAQQGDKMTVVANAESHQLQTIQVLTSLDGDAVEVDILHESLQDGPSYTARQIVKVPAQKVELTVENFNFQRQ
jgi:hypothetical protein